jgi:predicted DNA-binding antitoxin AbrB/MazE fold protein
MTIQAIFENGVFRPTGLVEIPEHCVVEFEPRIVATPSELPSLSDVYEILDRCFDSGESDVAARHNEHQP